MQLHQLAKELTYDKFSARKTNGESARNQGLAPWQLSLHFIEGNLHGRWNNSMPAN